MKNVVLLLETYVKDVRSYEALGLEGNALMNDKKKNQVTFMVLKPRTEPDRIEWSNQVNKEPD